MGTTLLIALVGLLADRGIAEAYPLDMVTAYGMALCDQYNATMQAGEVIEATPTHCVVRVETYADELLCASHRGTLAPGACILEHGTARLELPR